MIPYPHLDPVIVSLGPLKVRWYGMMYVIGFVAGYILVNRQIKRFSCHWLEPHFENLNTVIIIGLVLGARLGYIFFYNLPFYRQHPLEAFALWHGGLSFHGALIGVICAGFWYCRKYKLGFLRTADLYVVTVPVGLGFGRLGNFINGELFGRVSDVPWAMVFPAGGPMPRHPSQLYESFLEGVVLFTILWLLKNVHHKRKWPDGSMLAAFLIGYGLIRCGVEFFREPDVQLGLLAGIISMGQLLSILMIIAGVTLVVTGRRRGGQ